MTARYCLPLNVNRSTPILLHGLWGRGEVISGSLQCEQRYIISDMSQLIPGHHTAPLALSLHFVIPWWPWCVICRIFVRRDWGITTLSSWIKSLPAKDSCYLSAYNLARCLEPSLGCCGHPSVVHLIDSCIASSWLVESFIPVTAEWALRALIDFTLSRQWGTPGTGKG